MPVKSILGIALLCFFTACSPNGTIGTALPRDGSANYFPLAVGNEWQYQDEEGNEINLRVKDSVNEFETTGFNFASDSAATHRIATTNMLVNGTLHNISSRIIYNGNLPLYLPLFEDSLNIPLKNIVLLKQNNKAFQKVSEVKDSISRTYSFENREIPLHFNYRIDSYSDAVPKDFVIDGIPRENVFTGEISIHLSIEMRPYGKSPVVILPEQNVLKIQNHFIENLGIGLIEENRSYHFEKLDALHLKKDSVIEENFRQKVISYHFE